MPLNKHCAPTLDDIRKEIDRIDAELHALIVRRTDLASHVWTAKRTAPGGALPALSVVRPAREVQMLRALARHHTGAMPLATLWRIWRAFIIANIRVQAPFDVYVGVDTASGRVWDLARGHFGFETRMRAMPVVVQAVSAAREGAGVAVLPMADIGSWWRQIAQGGLRVFACLPQIGRGREAPPAVVVGDAGVEATGDDITLAVLATGGTGGADGADGADGAEVGDTIVAQGERRRIVYRFDAPSDGGEVTVVALAGFLEGAGEAPVRQVWKVNAAPVEAVVLGAYGAPVGETGND